jgi:hypothetical protein
MKFVAKSAGGLYDPYYLKIPFWEKWEEQLSLFNKKAPAGVNNVKQTAGLDWCLMIMEITLV